MKKKLNRSKAWRGCYFGAIVLNRLKENPDHRNQFSTIIILKDSSPSFYAKKILISEFYYHTHSGIKNEFIYIFNPTEQNINISDWYLSNNPIKNRNDQTKIIFPENRI